MDTKTRQPRACPRCAGPLVAREHGGVEVDICATCGVWFDAKELDALRRSSGQALSGLDHVLGNGRGSTAKASAGAQCPTCDLPLVTFSFRHVPEVILDGCRNCRGVWVDRGELTALESAVRRATTAPEPAGRFACPGCGADVYPSDLNCPQCKLALAGGTSAASGGDTADGSVANLVGHAREGDKVGAGTRRRVLWVAGVLLGGGAVPGLWNVFWCLYSLFTSTPLRFAAGKERTGSDCDLFAHVPWDEAAKSAAAGDCEWWFVFVLGVLWTTMPLLIFVIWQRGKRGQISAEQSRCSRLLDLRPPDGAVPLGNQIALLAANALLLALVFCGFWWVFQSDTWSSDSDSVAMGGFAAWFALTFAMVLILGRITVVVRSLLDRAAGAQQHVTPQEAQKRPGNTWSAAHHGHFEARVGRFRLAARALVVVGPVAIGMTRDRPYFLHAAVLIGAWAVLVLVYKEFRLRCPSCRNRVLRRRQPIPHACPHCGVTLT